MKVLIVVSMLCAVALAAPAPGLVSAPLLPKVQYGPAAVSVVRQPHVVTETELQYRQVPVPIKQVAYTAPEVHVSTPVIQAAPVVHAAPAVAYSAVASPAVAYGAVASPAVAYGAVASPAVAYGAVASPAVAYGAVASPAISYSSIGAVATPLSAATIL